MANNFPLILNTTSSTIQELPSGDNLDLSGSDISNVNNINSAGSLTTGAVTYVNTDGTSSQVLSTYGNGVTYWSTISTSSISNGNSNVNIATGNGNVTLSAVGNTIMTITGTGANITGTANITGNLTAANADLGNLVTANYSTAILTSGNQPNISNVGTLTQLTSNGVVNFTNSSNVSLGAVGNVKITGGSANQLIKTDGAGNLSFTTLSGDSYMLKPVRVATQATGNTALTGTYAIDGVSLAVGDRVLVTSQDSAPQNGIYIVQSGAWSRATDFDTGAATLIGGVSVTVTSGTQLTGVQFVCTNTTAITIGSTGITFIRTIGNTGFISIWSTGGFGHSRPAQGSTSSGATAMGVNAVAGVDGLVIGYNAVSGAQATALGYGSSAGASGTAVGTNSVASGEGTTVGYNSSARGLGVSIGVAAGRFSTASFNSISIGYQAGFQTQKANTVAIGYYTGYTNQGNASIAIGANAGYTNQANNSIILNATGANLDVTTANTFTVKPVRAVTDITGLKQMYYNPTTGEIVYYNV